MTIPMQAHTVAVPKMNIYQGISSSSIVQHAYTYKTMQSQIFLCPPKPQWWQSSKFGSPFHTEGDLQDYRYWVAVFHLPPFNHLLFSCSPQLTGSLINQTFVLQCTVLGLPVGAEVIWLFQGFASFICTHCFQLLFDTNYGRPCKLCWFEPFFIDVDVVILLAVCVTLWLINCDAPNSVINTPTGSLRHLYLC